MSQHLHRRRHDIADLNDHTPVAGAVGDNIVVIDPVTKLPIKDSGTSLASLTLGIDIQGNWDAATNTPALASGVGVAGHGYIVSVDGTTTLDGISEWKVNDTAWFDGTASVWRKLDRSDPTLQIVYDRGNTIDMAAARPLELRAGADGVSLFKLYDAQKSVTAIETKLEVAAVNFLVTQINNRIKINLGSPGNNRDITYYDANGNLLLLLDTNQISVNKNITPYTGTISVGTVSNPFRDIFISRTAKLDAIANTIQNALEILVDSDIMTTGLPIRVLSGPAYDKEIFKVDKNGLITLGEITGVYSASMQVDAAANLLKFLQGVIIDGDLDMNSNQITELADPTLAQDATTKNYVDVTHSGDAGAHHPQAHKDDHDPEDGADPLDCATPGSIDENANAEGTAHEFARADHNHQHLESLHENGGGAEINVGGLSGLLADDQHVLDAEVLAVAAALIHATRHQNGGLDEISLAGLSGEPADTVNKTLFDAQTILQATTDNTPAAITIAEQQIVGRITAGNIKGLSVAELWTLLGGKPTFVYQFSGTGGLHGSQTAYINIGDFFNVQSEAQSEFGKCRLIKLIINIPTNTLNSASTFQIEINGTPVGTAITYGATVTGRQSQVESITVATGDLLDVKAVLGGLVGNSIDILEVTGIFEGVQ